MKRYQVLVGHSFYPDGWKNWVRQYDTYDEAQAVGEKKASAISKRYGWYRVFDLETAQEIEH